MAIKIDLLPGYVGLRRVRKALSWGAAVLVASTGTVLFLVYYKGQQQLTVLQTNLENIEANAKAAEAAAAAAKAADAEAAPVATLVDFLAAAGRTGPERAALLDLTSHYIYTGAVISSLDLSDGQNVKITATVKTPEDYKALLLNLRQGSKSNGGVLFAEDAKTNMVTASGVPGFPATAPVIPTPGEQPVVINFPLSVNITGVLLNPVKLPVEPGAAAPAGGDAAGGAPPGGAPGQSTNPSAPGTPS
jgi:hypothetical protein